MLHASLAVSDFATIKVWNRDGRVVYATDHALIGRRFVPDLGRNLGLTVVAEGVESEAAWAELKALDCDFAQGYHLSRPRAANEVAAWIAARSLRAPADAEPGPMGEQMGAAG